MTLSANTASWTAADYKSATAGQIAGLTVAQVAALAHTDWLTAAAFAGFSASQVAAISISWTWMSAAQINALSAAATAAIPVGGIAALTTATIAGLGTSHLAALTTAQIAALSRTQIKALSATQVAAFSPTQIAAMTLAQVDTLSPAQIGGLSAAQVAVLSPAQLASLSAAQLGGLTAAAAAGLTSAQLAALGMAISGLSATAIAGLAPATVAALSGWQLADLTMAQIGALTRAQIAGLTAAKLGYLSPGALMALGSRVQAISLTALAGLTPVNVAAIYIRLSSAQIGALSSVQAAEVTLAKNTTATLLSGLTTGGLLTQVKAVSAAGQSLFSYPALLSILTATEKAIGSTGLSAAQLADLKRLTTAVGSVLGTQSYLYGVLAAMVNGNAANATWTGGATTSVTLGNLAVGSSAKQFDELLGKWFLGTDLPSWSTTTATSWVTKTADLFGTSGPTSADPVQGGIGDCYLIAATLDVAKVQPGLIASMFTDNGNGTCGVRLYTPGGAPIYFTVNGQVPKSGWTAGTATGAEWVTLLEKAFIAYKNEVHGAANAYDSISGGWAEGLTAITGKTVTNYIAAYTTSQAVWDTTVKNAVIAALAAGEEVLFGSFIDNKDTANGKTDLVSSHEFAVTGYDKATGCFVLQNPWGASGGSSWNGIFEQTIDQLWGGTTGNSRSSGFIVARGSSPSGATASAYAAAQLTQAIASVPQSAGTLVADSLLAAAAQGTAALHGLHLAAALR
ncbi:C2 family cysteine protease [Novosphingobium sp.]|uniref:C2 family cysteine protease n=1 Tax=Novosphingobium sp. TaxID=1874826 RepID=UPI00333F9C69